MATPGPQPLTYNEIVTVVYDLIGVDGGYLGNFTYAKHDRFWRQVAGLHVDTASNAPTRQCFEDTLGSVDAATQAAALRELLGLYPPLDRPDPENPRFRSAVTHDKILGWISRLETGTATVGVALASPSDLVRRALNDADALMASSGPQSAVDRVHTALHGYLHSLCDEEGIVVSGDRPTLNQLFRALRDNHSALKNLGSREEDIRKMLGSMATILDVLNPIRNNASVAHPNDDLVGPAEAVLVINLVRTMLGYLEQRRAQNSK